MDQEGLKAALKTIADKHWETTQKAMLLSDVAPVLAKEAGTVDYRTLLDGKSLKAFIKDTGESNGYRLVEHPTQSARIALAPLDSKFEFTTAVAEKTPKKSTPPRRAENKAIALLEILATLPEAELAQISIPVSALVKLLK
jgi:hypothetical protein